ncbi:MAG: baseplate J/gp47 family protein [Clostridia bacterium]|nr:baseplate J/gp47 family protein [Clostridia bacterium]
MANYIFTDNNGIVVADTADIKETIQGEYQTALGADLSLEDSTPQGRLIDIETDARTAVIENNVLISNSINFNLAFGIMLDAWGANFGLTRGAATSSNVIATITGVAGTVISAGSQAATQNGDIFYLENMVTIPASGSVTATFLSLEKGTITCPVNSLTKIIDGTLGWETITNSAPAVLGTETESDASFKQRFYDAGLFTGMSLVEDYNNALMNVPNVISCYVRDNGDSSAIVYDTVTIDGHSVFACVDGGDNTEVATALFKRKSGGCGWTGLTGQSVTVNVVDPTYGDTYPVTFNRPEQVLIYIAVTASIGISIVEDLETAIQNAITNYINTLKIGADVILLSLAAAINSAVPGINLTTLTIGTSSGSLASSNITIHINQVAKTITDNITVTIND